MFIYIYIYLYKKKEEKINKYFITYDKTGFYLKRGSDILESEKNIPARVRIWAISRFRAPINTYRVRAVPLVLDPQLLPR